MFILYTANLLATCFGQNGPLLSNTYIKKY